MRIQSWKISAKNYKKFLLFCIVIIALSGITLSTKTIIDGIIFAVLVGIFNTYILEWIMK